MNLAALKTNPYSSSAILVIALMVANGLNFLFNAYTGRVLSFENYALLTLINTFNYFLFVSISALVSTVTHRVSQLTAQNQTQYALHFLQRTSKLTLTLAAIATIIFIALTPFLTSFFQESSVLPLILYAPALIFGTLIAINRGYFTGSLYFHYVALIVLLEPLSKLTIAFILNLLQLSAWIYLSIPTSLLITALAAIWLTRNIAPTQPATSTQIPYRFPRRFFLAAFLAGASSTAFLSFDVLLAKHFLSNTEAGQYALLSLVGKMIFFIGSLPNVFMITLISRSISQNRNSRYIFYGLFAASAFLVISGFVFVGLLGNITVPFLFGAKAQSIVPYLSRYTFAMALFTLANTIVVYRLARQQYLFPILAVIMAGIMALAITFFHQDISTISTMVFTIAFINFFLMGTVDFLQERGRSILRNLVDLIDLFYPIPPDKNLKPNKKKLLIFNWRDTKHTQSGGAEVYVHELARRWAKDGHKITLFCGNDGHSPRFETVDGVHIVRRGGFYFVYLWAFLYYIFHFRGRYDLVLDCQNGVPFFTPMYVREPVYSVVYHVHQEVFNQHLPKPLAVIASFVEKDLMPWAYRNIQFIAISQSTKQDMVEKIGISSNKIAIVHSGVDLETLSPGDKSPHPTILYLGRLKAYKSVDQLIKAFKEILLSVPNAELIIAGTGDESDTLKKLAKKLDVKSKVKFVGRVTENQKATLLQQAWVFVNPSMQEGWGITTIEANACGTPVVASDVPGLRESVNNPYTGYLVEYGDIPALADKITQLLTNHTLRQRMSDASPTWAQQFTWRSSVQKFYRIMMI